MIYKKNLKKYIGGLIALIPGIFLSMLACTFIGCGNSKASQSPVNNPLIHTQELNQSNNQCIKYTQNTKQTLIVFVHGTILPLPSPSCIFPSFNTKNSKKKSWTGRYYEQLRYKTFFKFQPIANFGLENIDCLSPENTQKYPYAKISAKLYGNSYNFANPKTNSNLHFYTFGWEGRLSQETRLNSAKVLYNSLLTEISRIKNTLNLTEQNKNQDSDQDQNIEIILIGHSHGGNVLLNLAKIDKEIHDNLCKEKAVKLATKPDRLKVGRLKVGRLKVDKLILIGTPVQSETKKLISDPMFKKVYSFYSNGDMIQVIDIVSTEDAISKRRYNNSDKTSKLVQIELKIGKKEPRHTELWLFGGSDNSMLYRKHLAIYPLPAFVFIPVIIKQLDSKYPNAREILSVIDKNKKNKNFTIKLTDKTQKQAQTLTSISAQILEYKSANQSC